MVNRPPVSVIFNHALTGGLLLCLLFLSFTIAAKEIQVQPGKGTLQAAINLAQSGDTLRLTSGTYTGSIIIHHSISVIGKNQDSSRATNSGSIIDGEGSSHVITVSAPDVLITGVNIQHSGNTLETEDSGIFITDKGDRTQVVNNYFEHNQIGVYLKGPDSAIVSNNVIIGSQFHRMNDRGNGVYLWNTPGSVIKNNDIRYGRDGIFVNASRDNLFTGNYLHDLRFAIHYMYANDSEVSNNISRDNHVGFAIMFSDRILIKNNLSSGDRERGLFFNYTNYSIIDGNRVTGSMSKNITKDKNVGPVKCVFIYNANFNQINNNSFEECQIGIHFTAGSEKNEIYSNAFINNRSQVKYVGTRYIEWSKDGHGNYWSDNAAFDINDDGIADRPYKPNNLVDQIIWRHPIAKLLLNSPSVQLIKWAQTEFPGLHPGGVTDSAPLMLPPSNTHVTDRLVSSLIE